jgi:hypothetical protein
LNLLSKKMKLFHIKETSLVAFKAAQWKSLASPS